MAGGRHSRLRLRAGLGRLERWSAHSPVDERLEPVLRQVGTVTRSAATTTPAAAEPVLAAGWSEQARHDAIMVSALLNLMNRTVDGHGIHADADYYPVSGQRLKDRGHAGLGDLLPR